MSIVLYLVADLICVFLTFVIGIIVLMLAVFLVFFLVEVYKEHKAKENNKK